MAWGVSGLHALAAGAALALPFPAWLPALAGIALSAADFLYKARTPMFLHCQNGVVTGCLDCAAESGHGAAESEDGAAADASGDRLLHPVRVVPLPGQALLVLEFAGPRGRRYRTVARGSLPERDYRMLLLSARWPARLADGRAA
jgi:hypothetical protein